ncbi:MAG: exodeoxyribonuclease III [Phycisphaerae bacterium]|nr:exodeoxyribonuclease III [Phycisphaerae bacterium]
MKIATFNVNSLPARLDIVVDWIKTNSPDCLCLQETKVQDINFPKEAFDSIGCNVIFSGQKSYNGVAIISPHKIENPIYGFDTEPADTPRFIVARIKNITIVNTYIPQGYQAATEKFQYKLQWFSRLRDFFDKNFTPNDSIIWTGDFNVAMTAKDIYDPEGLYGSVCYRPEVWDALKSVTDWGFTDIFRMHTDAAGQYTFWDYRIRNGVKRNFGWRLDYIMATESLSKKCAACYIDKAPRLKDRPSDHTPLVAKFDL